MEAKNILARPFDVHPFTLGGADFYAVNLDVRSRLNALLQNPDCRTLPHSIALHIVPPSKVMLRSDARKANEAKMAAELAQNGYSAYTLPPKPYERSIHMLSLPEPEPDDRPRYIGRLHIASVTLASAELKLEREWQPDKKTARLLATQGPLLMQKLDELDIRNGRKLRPSRLVTKHVVFGWDDGHGHLLVTRRPGPYAPRHLRAFNDTLDQK